MRQIRLPKLHAINVIIDVDRVATRIPAKLLNEFAFHPRSSEVGRKPVSTAMGSKTLLQINGIGIVEANRRGVSGDNLVVSVAFQTTTGLAREQRVGI